MPQKKSFVIGRRQEHQTTTIQFDLSEASVLQLTVINVELCRQLAGPGWQTEKREQGEESRGLLERPGTRSV